MDRTANPATSRIAVATPGPLRNPTTASPAPMIVASQPPTNRPGAWRPSMENRKSPGAGAGDAASGGGASVVGAGADGSGADSSAGASGAGSVNARAGCP